MHIFLLQKNPKIQINHNILIFKISPPSHLLPENPPPQPLINFFNPQCLAYSNCHCKCKC